VSLTGQVAGVVTGNAIAAWAFAKFR
jgi:hypothetical protein